MYSFVWDSLNSYKHLLLDRLSESSSVSNIIVPSQTPSEKTQDKKKTSLDLSSSSRDSFLTMSKEGFLSEKKVLDTDSQKNRSSRIRRGIMAGPISSSSQVMNFDLLNLNEWFNFQILHLSDIICCNSFEFCFYVIFFISFFHRKVTEDVPHEKHLHLL